MSELTLKPCPFCGGVLTGDDIYFGECEAETYEGILSKVRRERFIGGAAVYFVHCPHCDAHLGGLHKGDFGSPEEAADNWNTSAYEKSDLERAIGFVFHEADARLIANAPEMYAMLKSLSYRTSGMEEHEVTLIREILACIDGKESDKT